MLIVIITSCPRTQSHAAAGKTRHEESQPCDRHICPKPDIHSTNKRGAFLNRHFVLYHARTHLQSLGARRPVFGLTVQATSSVSHPSKMQHCVLVFNFPCIELGAEPSLLSILDPQSKGNNPIARRTSGEPRLIK